ERNITKRWGTGYGTGFVRFNLCIFTLACAAEQRRKSFCSRLEEQVILMNKCVGLWAIVCAFFLGFGGPPALAAMYNYQVYQGNGIAGPVGTGSLAMSNSSSVVYGQINKGMGAFADNLVMFIDSVPGGFTDTS